MNKAQLVLGISSQGDETVDSYHSGYSIQYALFFMHLVFLLQGGMNPPVDPASWQQQSK